MAELDITPNVSGSGADTQVAYWSGPTVLTSSANLITDSSGNSPTNATSTAYEASRVAKASAGTVVVL